MSPFIASWGIIGCGWISSEFTKDLSLLRDDVTDVYHSIAAVGSRDKSKAEKFIADFTPKGANGQQLGHVKSLPEACGSYDEVYNHEDVNIIYIGTLNPSHYSDAKSALEAGKHCLIEKPACLNAAEWKDLSALATTKNLFLMEGMWTRFQPAVLEIQKKLHVEKAIGEIKHVRADFSMAFYNALPDTHRLISMEAAGGPVLDLGPYIINPTILALYLNPANENTAPEVAASMLKARTGVDLSTSITLNFPKIDAQAVLSTSLAYNSPKDERCVIIGTHGEIVINNGLSQITQFTLKKIDEEPTFFVTKWKEPEVFKYDLPKGAFGLFYEADAVARSLRDGEVQSKGMPHDHTTLVLSIIDRVREIGGYVLPEGLEKLK